LYVVSISYYVFSAFVQCFVASQKKIVRKIFPAVH